MNDNIFVKDESEDANILTNICNKLGYDVLILEDLKNNPTGEKYKVEEVVVIDETYLIPRKI